jgi:FkbM family methyltransferase
MQNINSYAEFETDKYIYDNFFYNLKEPGVMVEVGAALPDSLSMSKGFKELGWRCICVDPIPHYAESHRKAGNEIYEVALSDGTYDTATFDIYTSPAQHKDEGMSCSGIRGKVNPPGYLIPFMKTITVKVDTLNNILETAKVDNVDFVSIDVEGWELDVLRGFDLKKYTPKIIVLENLKHDVAYNNYMESKGYKMVHNLSYNQIYEKNN